MLRFLLPVLLFCFSSGLVFSQNVEEQTVLDAEARRFSAMTHRDTLAMQKMLAPDLVYIHSNGLVERGAEHWKSIATGRLTYETMQREEATARLYKKIALVNGVVKAKGILNGTPFEVRLRYTAVYQHKKGHWLLINWQSTRIS